MKLLGEELVFNSYFHAIVSVAVIIKTIFLVSAVTCFLISKEGDKASRFYTMFLRIKDVANEITKILVFGLMAYVFRPGISRSKPIDGTLKALFFLFALISLVEVHWNVLFHVRSDTINVIQFFAGRTGSLKQQMNHDRRVVGDTVE